ncbi:MAG: hypothetical protein GXO91_03985 [FCB group bacterium]|nr:hypothetical protein [FCB group bacterium]
MKHTRRFLDLLFLVIFILVAGCEKDSPTPTANPGAMVRDYEICPTDWYSYGEFGEAGYGFEAVLASTQISKHILAEGTVLIYQDGFNYRIALPYSDAGVNSIVKTSFTTETGVALVHLEDNQGNIRVPSATIKYRMLIIDDQPRITNPELDLRDYQDVAAFYDLN